MWLVHYPTCFYNYCRNKDRNFINTLQGKESCATVKWYIAIVTVGVLHLRKQGKILGKGVITLSANVFVLAMSDSLPSPAAAGSLHRNMANFWDRR